MKRIGVLVVFVAAAALSGGANSHAAMTTANGFCFQSPDNRLVPCNTSPTPTRALILPNKTVSISGPVSAPLDTTTYLVTITSSVACFALDEPVLVYPMGGGNGAAVLSPLQPAGAAGPSPQSVVIHVDPATTTATLSLEVLNRALGTGGLVVKAVWPAESVERLVRVINPASPTAVPTVPPGAATNTPVPTATAIPTATAVPTATATATGTPGPTPTSTPTGQAFFVRTCITPNPSLPLDFPTIYVQTLPNAVCTSSVLYSNNSQPNNFAGGPQTAGPDGFAVFPFQQQTVAPTGVVMAQCTLNGARLSARAAFTVNQPTTPTPGPTR